MEKFKNDDLELCIVSVTDYHELTLNKEIINLLSSLYTLQPNNKFSDYLLFLLNE